MSGDIVIEAHGLGKKFCPALRRSLAYAAIDIASELLPGARDRDRLRRGEFRALNGIDLSVRRGEALALIGHNGAGKSTLLKILYGLLQPDTGSFRMSGSVVALIELGAGINPLLTARENILLVASLNGLSRARAASIIPDVLDFAELGHVADVAVRSFSTGMRARLSYAIAAMLRPDILLIDEVLAVGDLAFQRKCITHLQRFLASGGTLVLVSHAPHHVQAICSQAILLDHGEIVAAGDPAHVTRRYLEMRPAAGVQHEDGATDALIRIEDIAIEHRDGGTARSGEDATVRIRYDARGPLDAYCGLSIWSQDGWTCITSTFDPEALAIQPGPGTVDCAIARLPLVAGRYLVRLIFADRIAHARIPLGGPAGGGTIAAVEGQPGLFSNGQMQMGQLITIDADWTPHTLLRDLGTQAVTECVAK